MIISLIAIIRSNARAKHNSKKKRVISLLNKADWEGMKDTPRQKKASQSTALTLTKCRQTGYWLRRHSSIPSSNSSQRNMCLACTRYHGWKGKSCLTRKKQRACNRVKNLNKGNYGDISECCGQRPILKKILDILWSDYVTKGEERIRSGQPLTSSTICKRHVSWLGHVPRLPHIRTVHQALLRTGYQLVKEGEDDREWTGARPSIVAYSWST